MKGASTLDPKALIYEAFRIEGITEEQCRSIFLDWALSLPGDLDTKLAIRTLLEQHAEKAPDHPMGEILRQGLTSMASPKRRGGWRSRPR